MFLNLGTAPHGPPPPFSAWSRKQIQTIERAIVQAWSQITRDPHCQAVLTGGTEPQITAMLQDALCDLLNAGQVTGFSPATYLCPIRGQELDDYTGKRLEKRPDLTFPRLSARPASNHNALFFECKIVGRGRPLDDYVEDGVGRFQEGIYAWAMPHAGMLAYVVGAEAADPCSALAATWSTDTGRAAPYAPIEPVSGEGGVSAIALSRHARTFTLRNGEAPGQILLRHLWLHFPLDEEDR
jgi:hypothetical protein